MSIRGQLIGAAAITVTAFASAWAMQSWRYEAKIAQIQTDAAQQLAYATQLARQSEQARWAAREVIINDAKKQTMAALAEADSARAASERLRTQLAELQHRARDTTTAPGGAGKSDTDSIGVLAQLYSWMDENGRSVSKYADQLRIAGVACEAAHDSLR